MSEQQHTPGRLKARHNAWAAEITQLEQQRDELLAALVYVEERLARSGYPDGPNLQTIRAAIAKCKQ